MVDQVLWLLVCQEVPAKGHLVEAEQVGILVHQGGSRLVEDFMFGIDDTRRDLRRNAAEKYAVLSQISNLT